MRPPWGLVFPESVPTPGCLGGGAGTAVRERSPSPQGRAERPVQPDEDKNPPVQRAEWGPCSNLESRGEEDGTETVSTQGGVHMAWASTSGDGGLLLSGEGCLRPPRVAGHCTHALTRGSSLYRPEAHSCGPRPEGPGLGTQGRDTVSYPKGLHLKLAVAMGSSSSLAPY